MSEREYGWSTIVKAAVIAAVVGASLIAAAKGHAAEPGAADTSSGATAGFNGIPHADVHVRVIHAKLGEKHFDAHLDDLKRYLDKYRYSSYHVVIDDTLHLETASTQSIGLLSGKSLAATLVAVTPEKATIRLVLSGQAGQMLDTSVGVGPGQLFFIAGPRYDDGVLFIAIEPHYDPNNLPKPAVSDRDDTPRHH